MAQRGLSFNDLLRERKNVIGSLVLSKDSTTVRIADASNLDFLLLDFEHGAFTKELTAEFVNASVNSNVSILARCDLGDLHQISSLMDHGLDGVIVAGVRTVEEVQLVIEKTKFTPVGKRGINPFVPANDYGAKNGLEFAEEANKKSSVWIIAENEEIISNLEEVCKNTAIDGVFLGPYDLSFDMDYPGEINNKAVINKINEALTIVQSHGIPTGIFVKDTETAEKWIAQGVKLLVIGIDSATLAQAWQGMVKQLNPVSTT